jgi:hypothetical protein
MPLRDEQIEEIWCDTKSYRTRITTLRAIARAAEEAAQQQIGEWLKRKWVSYTENQIDGTKRMCFSMSEVEWTTLCEGKEMDIGMPVPPHVDHALARSIDSKEEFGQQIGQL